MSYMRGTVCWIGSALREARPLLALDVDPGNQMALAAAAASISDDRAITLLGGVGRGKTTILAAIYAELRLRPSHKAPMWGYLPRWAVWTTAAEYVADVKHGWDFAAQFKAEWSDRFSADGIAGRVPRLFIDDLGVEPGTDFARETIADLLTVRYARSLSTWIASNLTLKELRARYGDRVASRLAEASGIYEIGGPDRRLAKAVAS